MFFTYSNKFCNDALIPKSPVVVRDNQTYKIHQPYHEVIGYQTRAHVYLGAKGEIN